MNDGSEAADFDTTGPVPAGTRRTMTVDTVGPRVVWLIGGDEVGRLARSEWSPSPDLYEWWPPEPGLAVDVEVLSFDHDAGVFEVSRRSVVDDCWDAVVDVYERGAPIHGWVFAGNEAEVAVLLATEVIGVCAHPGPTVESWAWFAIERVDRTQRTISLVPAVPADDSDPPRVRFWSGLRDPSVMTSLWGQEPGDPWTAQWWDQHGFDAVSAWPWRTSAWNPIDAGRYWGRGVDHTRAGAFRSAGFSPADGAAWAVIGDPDAAAEFRDAGFAPNDADEWARAGFEAVVAASWRAVGCRAAEASRWRNSDASPTEAAPWVSSGLDVDSAVAWRGEAFAPDEALAWSTTTFAPAVAREWSDRNLTPAQSEAWSAVGCRPETVSQWEGLGGPADAALWISHGFDGSVAQAFAADSWTPSDAIVWVDAGHSAASATAWRTVGATTSDAAEAMGLELSPTEWATWVGTDIDRVDISAWLAAGTDPATATAWVRAGVTARDVGTVEPDWTPDRYDAWRTAGMTLPEAQRWSILGDVRWSRRWRDHRVFVGLAAGYVDAGWSDDDALRWAEAAFSPDDARAWADHELTPTEARPWASHRIGPEAATRWIDAGFAPATAARWRGAGFGADDARSWASAGFPTPVSAQPWAHTGFTANLAGAWRAAEFDPDAAIQWAADAFNPVGARRWAETGFDASDAATWRAEGFDAVNAQAWRDEGHRPARAGKWAEAGWEPHAAAEWLGAAFRSPNVAKAWADHCSPTEARPWVDAGWSQPAAAMRWRRARWSPTVALDADAIGLEPADGRSPPRLPPPVDAVARSLSGRAADRLFGSPRTEAALARWAGTPPGRRFLNRQLDLPDAALHAANWVPPRRLKPRDAVLLPAVLGLGCGSEDWERAALSSTSNATPFVFQPQIAELFLSSEPVPDDVRRALRLPFDQITVLLGAPFRFDDDHLALLKGRRSIGATYEPWLDRLAAAGGALAGFVLTSNRDQVPADAVVWLVEIDRTIVPIPGTMRSSILRPSAELALAGLLYSEWFRVATATQRTPAPPVGHHEPGDVHVIDMQRVRRDLYSGNGVATGSRAAHLRRGHFRRQPHGPRFDPWYETIWIRPQVIGGTIDADHRRRVYRVPAIT